DSAPDKRLKANTPTEPFGQQATEASNAQVPRTTRTDAFRRKRGRVGGFSREPGARPMGSPLKGGKGPASRCFRSQTIGRLDCRFAGGASDVFAALLLLTAGHWRTSEGDPRRWLGAPSDAVS